MASSAEEIPTWRRIFDQGFISRDILDHHYKGSGTENDPYQVSWLENDPWDPMQYPDTFKWFITILVGVDTMAVSLVSSAYSGGLVQILLDFRVSEEVAVLGISLFVLGFALGPIIWAPLSEVYGRRYILLASAAGLTAFTAGAAGAQNIGTLLVLRFFGGSIGSAPFAVSGGVIADTFPTITRGLASALYAAAPFLGPTLGPIVGGFLAESSGWRWVEGMVAIFSGVIGLLMVFTLPETYAPVLLRKRAERLSAITGRVYRSKLDIEKGRESLSTLLKVGLSRPWLLLFFEPIVLLFSIYLSIIYGILYMFFTAMPIVYQEKRGWSEGTSGLAFLGIMVGILLMVLATFPAYQKLKKNMPKSGRLPPEARLPGAYAGAIALPIGLFWFAWTNSPSVPWIVSILAGVPFGFGMLGVFLPVLTYLLDAYTMYAASVLAASAALRSVFGAVFPLFTKIMYDNLGIHWASSIPAFLALACVPMPFLFHQYGAAIRARCPYAAESEAFMEKLLGQAAPPKEDIERPKRPQSIKSPRGSFGRGHEYEMEDVEHMGQHETASML